MYTATTIVAVYGTSCTETIRTQHTDTEPQTDAKTQPCKLCQTDLQISIQKPCRHCVHVNTVLTICGCVLPSQCARHRSPTARTVIQHRPVVQAVNTR